MLVLLHAIEVENLEALMEASREFVLSLPFGNVLHGPSPPSRVGNRLSIDIPDRDGDPPLHRTSLAVPEREGFDELGGEAPFDQVWVIGFEGEREPELL